MKRCYLGDLYACSGLDFKSCYRGSFYYVYDACGNAETVQGILKKLCLVLDVGTGGRTPETGRSIQ